MSATTYYIVHLISGFLLTGVTFAAFAAPVAETRKRTLMFSGILSFAMLVGGFGLLAKLGYSAAAPWVLVKIVCWLGLSALGGMAYRMPGKRGLLSFVGAALIAIAISTVYLADKTIEPSGSPEAGPAPSLLEPK